MSIFLCICIQSLYLETLFNCRDNRICLRHSLFLKIGGSNVLLVMQIKTSIIPFLGKVHSSLCTSFLLQSLLRSVCSWWYKRKTIPRTPQEFDCNIKYSCSSKISAVFRVLAHSQNSSSKYQQCPEMPVIVYNYNCFEFLRVRASHNTEMSFFTTVLE